LDHRAALELSALLDGARAAIVRRWRRARGYRLAELDPLVDELARLLATRDCDAPEIFAALVGGVGVQRAAAGASTGEAARELAALTPAVLAEWGRRSPRVPADGAALLAATVDAGVVALVEEHARAACAERLRAHDSLAARALELVRDGVLAVDERHRVVLCNRTLADWAGASEGALLGLSAGEAHARLGLVALDDERGQRVRVRERVCAVSTATASAGTVTLLHDVTDELRCAAELARADRELGALHTRLLRGGRDRAVGDLASSTALKLNNELNAIKLQLELVRAQPIAEPVARHLDGIDAAVLESARLVARLQELAARRPRGAARALELDELVAEAIDLVRPELVASSSERSLRVDVRLGGAGPVRAPAVELREALWTLLGAARVALGEGGDLDVRTAIADAQSAEVEVSHTGAPAADAARAGAVEAARDAAARAGASLTVATRDGRTRYRLLLPRAKPAPAPPAPEAAAPSGARRVLIVDDDDGNRETLDELLALSGHEVTSAATPSDALAAAQRQPLDAALVDLAMPEMNGWELARRLHAIVPSLRIAIVTGWEPATAEEARPHGLVQAVFGKPLDLAAIQRFLDETQHTPPALR
jgi:CheY-like chemotaxis protein/signal transduction histidine kinase